jgi:hypothetical protein
VLLYHLTLKLDPCLVASPLYALVRICGVDNHCILRLIVNNKVGVVIARARPYALELVSAEHAGDS